MRLLLEQWSYILLIVAFKEYAEDMDICIGKLIIITWNNILKNRDSWHIDNLPLRDILYQADSSNLNL